MPPTSHDNLIMVCGVPAYSTSNMSQEADPKKPLKPGPGDYYFENGFMVFTEAYHLKRGYCCKSGCRHCPYGFKKPGSHSPGTQA